MTRQMPLKLPALPASDISRLEEGRHPDPFAVLGRHIIDDVALVRTWLPGANYVELVTGAGDERRATPMIGMSRPPRRINACRAGKIFL